MKRILTILFSLAISLCSYAQTRITAGGTVVDKDGAPIIGAVVAEKGTGNAVITNLNGEYTLAGVTEGADIEISFIGLRTEVFKAVKGKKETVTMQDDANFLDKAVVIGYGTVKKRDITGAVISVSGSELENKIPTDIFEAMQGSVPGVQIVSNSGAPGEGSSVRVRGIATFGDGVEPLYVVDGLPVENADLINPNDVLSIEILKDAASAAIYGSRSANGVILVTTKKGTPGKSRIQAKYQFSSNTVSNCIQLTTPAEFRYFDQVRQELGQTTASNYTDVYNHFQNSGENILDHIFRTAAKHQADVSASGGRKEFKYYAGLGLISEEGVVVGSGYDKVSMRVNLDYQAAPNVRIGHRLYSSFNTQNGLYSESDVLSNMLNWVPYWNIFKADGTLIHNMENRNSALTYALEGTNKKIAVNSSVLNFVEIQLAEGLKFTSNLSGNFMSTRRQTYKPTILLGTSATDKTTGMEYAWNSYTMMNENYFNYSLKKDRHEFSAVLGESFQYWRTDYLKVTGQDYSTDELYTLNFASEFKSSDTTSTISEHSLLSFFARANYTFNDRYIFAANLRSDASSRFGSDRRWAVFPSASAGWRFSDEPFMKWASSFLYEGKFRASYGITGNEAIGNYDALMTYSPGSYYEGVSGVAPSRLGNPMLGWETTTQTNFGVDLSFFNNRLTITADYYDKNTSDLLYQCQLPKETGFSSITRNVGAMYNNGIELAVGITPIRKNGWKWDLSFNISHNNAIIRKLADGVPFYTGSDSAIYVQENARVGEFYGYTHDGIFAYDESNAFTPDWKQLTPVFEGSTFSGYTLDGKAYTGEVKQKVYSDGSVFKGGDVNWLEAPGSENGVIDIDDRVNLGCAQADVFGGLTSTLEWKGLSLYMAFYYSLGGQIYNYGRKVRNTFQYTYTSPEPYVIANMWTEPGCQALYARPVSTVSYNHRIGPSDFWIEDASFVKLKNLKLSYNLPKKMLKKAKISSIQTYAYANNLLTWTSYSGFDPEFSGSSALNFGIDPNRYPRKREFGFGVTLYL